ncbi:MAG TPA: hypothetical protein VKA09_08450 [Nitrososphaeraceae archaeon]|nr:hypothetical protein [Nitrososphaeraceae archaeon]
MTLTITCGHNNIKRAVMGTSVRIAHRPATRTIGMISTLAKERQAQNHNM